jgi:hypothetical protein
MVGRDEEDPWRGDEHGPGCQRAADRFTQSRIDRISHVRLYWAPGGKSRQHLSDDAAPHIGLASPHG